MPAAGAGTPCSTASRIALSPVSEPIGDAPARQSLMPLYRAGLWLAVNIAPGTSSAPEAKYSMSVLARPMFTTSNPYAATPSANAAPRSGDAGRMPGPTPTTAVSGDSARSSRAIAAPTSRTSAASICSPTTPRTS